MSKASKMTIDNATQRAIERGQLDLRYASPLLREVAAEIWHSHRGGRGVLYLFGGLHDDDRRDKETESERQKLIKEHERWVHDHRSSSVPRDWELLTDNGKVQSYSDGDTIHYVHANGQPMNERETHEELDRRYGSGD